MKSTGAISIYLTAILSFAVSAGAQVQYKVVDLGTLGGGISNAYGVNDLTQVVGVSQIAGGFNHGFLWMKPHGMKDLGTLGGNFSSAQAINDASEIVGQAATSQSTADAFLRKGSTMQDLGSLGGSSSQANAINFNPLTQDFSQIAGWSLTAGNGPYHAVVWDSSLNIMYLGTLGGSASQANAVNDLRQIVGSSTITGDTDEHAFLWTSQRGMQDLNSFINHNSGWDLRGANSISNNGRIVGSGLHQGQLHGFLLIPE